MCSSAKGEEGECCNSLVESYEAAREYFYSMLQKKTSKAHYKRVHSSTLLGESSRKVYTYGIMGWNCFPIIFENRCFQFFLLSTGQILWEGHKIGKNTPLFWRFSTQRGKKCGRFFQILSEYLYDFSKLKEILIAVGCSRMNFTQLCTILQ